MVFNSVVFLFGFLPLALLLYYLVPGRLKNAVLLLESLAFYCWTGVQYLPLIAFLVVFNYIWGVLEELLTRRRPLLLTISVLVNLAALVYFKYANFLIDSLNSLTQLGIARLDVGAVLPLGISYYIFKIISYQADICSEKIKAEKDPVTFAAYVLFFPQLIVGPIIKYRDMAPQLHNTRDRCTAALAQTGCELFVFGLAQKVILADSIGALWSDIIGTGGVGLAQVSTPLAWLGILAYSLQLYLDFAGFSAMSNGLAAMLGFECAANFDLPYISGSITEFWRRWHISLGTWFREYLYIPLGGNRKGKGRQILNLLIVWGCTGFWHGASWNFLLWGLYFAVILIFEKLFLLKRLERCPSVISHIYALLLILCGWVIFAFDNLSQIGAWFGVMFHFGASQAAGESFWYLLQTHWVLFLVLAVGSTEWPGRIWRAAAKKLESKPWLVCLAEVLFLGTVFLVSTAFLAGDSYNPFLYFRF